MRRNRAERLDGLPLLDVPILPQLREDVLNNLCLLRRWRPAEDVEFDVEPIVDLFVDLVIPFASNVNTTYSMISHKLISRPGETYFAHSS